MNEPDYELIFEGAADGILLVNADTGEVTNVNRTFVAMSGYSRGEVTGQKIWEIPAITGVVTKLIVSQVAEGKGRIFLGDQVLETKDGKRVNAEILCIVQRGGPGTIVQCSIRDVTERKRSEQSRWRSQDQFRRLFENNPHPLWVFESDSLAFLAVNEAAIQTYGFLREEFMKMTMRDLLLPEEIPDFMDSIENVRSPLLKPDVWKQRKKNGDVIDVEIASNELIFQGRNARFVVATDVTASKHAENLLKESRRLLQEMLSALPVGILITDNKGNVIIRNPAIQKIWGDERSVGMDRYEKYKGWWAASGKQIGTDEWAAARALLRGETSLDEVVDIEGFDGSRKTILNSAVPLRDSRGQIAGAIVVNQDITERRRQEEELRRVHTLLEHQATTDVLTGVFNRLKFNELLDFEMREARRYGHLLSLIMFDVDHFKSINDRFGHFAGDAVLKEIAALVSANIRSVDIFARWGGEEFVILSPDTPLGAAKQLAEKLRLLIAQHHFSCSCAVTASFGLTQFRDEDIADRFISRADGALYGAKEQGRDRIEAH